MKTIQKYVCEKCGKEFDSEFDCTNHEVEGHINPVKYTPIYGENSVVPSSIKVEFENSRSELYFLSEF